MQDPVGWIAAAVVGSPTSASRAYMVTVVGLATLVSALAAALFAAGGEPDVAWLVAALGAFHVANALLLRWTGAWDRFDVLAWVAPLACSVGLAWQLRGTELADLGALWLLPVIAWAAMFTRRSYVVWTLVIVGALAVAVPILPAVWPADRTLEPGLVGGVRVITASIIALCVAGPVLSLSASRRRLSAALRDEHARSERLLLNVLPAPVAARLKAGATVADTIPDATVLFVDLVGFTKLSETMGPDALVSLLDRVFSSFDDLARRHGLEKIKTIGDAWMVVGGAPEPRPDHVEAVARLAIDILQVVEREPGLEVRIGLHCGPLVAGVIGRSKFGYDVWGDTVNTASRMESHGEAGRIHLSADAARRLEGAFRIESRGMVPIKGKGEMATSWLVGARTRGAQ